MPIVIPPAHRAVLETLESAGRACTLKEIAELSGRHQSTVRDHIAELVEWGLVTSRPRPPAGRGRPARLYGPTGPGSHGHEDLSTALAVEVASGPRDPATAAARIGHELAHGSVDSPEELLAALTRSGYNPEDATDSDAPDDPEIHLHHCPFLATARAAPDLMCAIHTALVDAWVEEGPLADRKAALDPQLVRSGTPCVLTLRVADPSHTE